jgi:RNA-directed DNA polymerase
VQAALKLVLEPVGEADFLPCSYGFGPKRRAHNLIAEIRRFASAPHRLRIGAGGRNRGVLQIDVRAWCGRAARMIAVRED